MDEPTIDDWLDRHHVEVIRTHATHLDGPALGKYLNRNKFVKALPDGHNIADMALAMDIAGTPHLTFWHAFRNAHLGDIRLQPDLDTIIWDGIDPDLGHVICDFVSLDGAAISICPRSQLKQVTRQVQDHGYQVKAAFELEFFLFNDSYDEARQKQYQGLSPIAATTSQFIYSARSAYRAKPFMNEVIKRLNWQRIIWESWNDEGGAGQIELNFPPADPVTAADAVIRAKQIIYETAVDMGVAATFMPHCAPGYSSGLHVHHSLLDENDEPVFVEDGSRSQMLQHWLAGIVRTIPAATSILCPSINAYRRFAEFAGPPMTASWGEENKSSAIRVISAPAKAARLEHRLASSEANPYLALAVILAGGLSGLNNRQDPPAENLELGWSRPKTDERLPLTISSAADVLQADEELAEIMGEDFIDYWINSRRWEWLNFHDAAENSTSRTTTLWEYERYFELV